MGQELHVPVLLNEICEAAGQLKDTPRFYLDFTLGRGGHLRALLEKFPQMRALGVDRDTTAIDFAKEAFATAIAEERLQLLHGEFKELSAAPEKLLEYTGGRGFDLIMADLGVSSPQLDEAKRGFSFYHDGPLDMRMDQSRGPTAADIVNSWSERDLLQLFREYGEIRRPEKVVRAIIHDRREKPFETTMQLAGLIERIEGWRKKGWHPATLYFLALRLETNQELAGLDAAVKNWVHLLAPGGRLLVITFHSLEDRILKYTLKECGDVGFAVNKKVIQASRSEQQANPRARSAKLRVFERGERVTRKSYST